jgi:hypothetical protein
MKKLLILFLTVAIFTACNNNGKNPFAKKTGTDKTEEGSDDKDVKKKKGGLFAKDDDDAGKDDSKNSWTKSYRDKLMEACQDEMKNDPQARSICSCAVDKLEKKYPDQKDADEAIETDGRKMLDQCKTSTGGNDGYTDDRYKNKEKDIDVPVDEGSHGASWTPLQRQQYIQACEGTARKNNQQGYSDQQINSYCDCMTRKVEKKYSFQQAARMTVTDFQTQEWQSAAADCMPKY